MLPHLRKNRFHFILFAAVLLLITLLTVQLFKPFRVNRDPASKAQEGRIDYSQLLSNPGFEQERTQTFGGLFPAQVQTAWNKDKSAHVQYEHNQNLKTEGGGSMKILGKIDSGVSQTVTVTTRDLIKYSVKVLVKKGSARLQIEDEKGKIIAEKKAKASDSWQTLTLVPYPWSSSDFHNKLKLSSKAKTSISYRVKVVGGDTVNEFYTDEFKTERTGGSGRPCRLREPTEVSYCQFYEYCDADPGLAGTCEYNPSWPRDLTDAQAVAIYEVMKEPVISNKGIPLLLPAERLNPLREMYIRRYWPQAALDVVMCFSTGPGPRDPHVCPDVYSLVVRGEITKLQEFINDRTIKGALKAMYPDLSEGDLAILEDRMFRMQLSHLPNTLWNSALITCDFAAFANRGPCAVVGRLMEKGIAAVGKPILQAGRGLTSWVFEGASSIIGKGSELVTVRIAALKNTIQSRASGARLLRLINPQVIDAGNRWPSLSSTKLLQIGIDDSNGRRVFYEVFPIEEIIRNSNDGYISSQMPEVFDMLGRRFGVYEGLDYYVYVASSPQVFDDLLEEADGYKHTMAFIRFIITKNGDVRQAIIINPGLESKWWFKVVFHEGIHAALVDQLVGGPLGWILRVTGTTPLGLKVADLYEEFITATVSGFGYPHLRAEVARQISLLLAQNPTAYSTFMREFNYQPNIPQTWTSLEEYVIKKVIPEYMKSAAGSNEYGLPLGANALDELNRKWELGSSYKFTEWLLNNINPSFWPSKSAKEKIAQEGTITLPICSENVDCDTPVSDLREAAIDSLSILSDPQNGLGLPDEITVDKEVLDSAIELAEAVKVWQNNDLELPVDDYRPIVEDNKNWQLDVIPDIPTEMFEDSEHVWQPDPNITPRPTDPNPRPTEVVPTASPAPVIPTAAPTRVPDPTRIPTVTPSRIPTATPSPTPRDNQLSTYQMLQTPRNTVPWVFSEGKIKFTNTNSDFIWQAEVPGRDRYVQLKPVPGVTNGNLRVQIDRLVPNVGPGESWEFPFRITSDREEQNMIYALRLYEVGGRGFFGSTYTGTISVNTDPTPRLAGYCRRNNFPSTLYVNQRQSVSTDWENRGQETWGSNIQMKLVSNNVFHPQGFTLERAIGGRGGDGSVIFDLVAPSTPGTYVVEYKLHEASTNTTFGDTTNCRRTITVAGPTPTLSPTPLPLYRASCEAFSPQVILTGRNNTVNVKMKNTGSATWGAALAQGLNESVLLDAEIFPLNNSQSIIQNRQTFPALLGDHTESGASREYPVSFIIPHTTVNGTYMLKWRMSLQNGLNNFNGQMSPECAYTIRISDAPPSPTPLPALGTKHAVCGTPSYSVGEGAEGVYPGRTFTVHIPVKNTGTQPWSKTGEGTANGANPFRLVKQNVNGPSFNPINGGYNSYLDIIPQGTHVYPNQWYTFSFTATAPQTTGTYPMGWKMAHEGHGLFGEQCNMSVSVVNIPAPSPTIDPRRVCSCTNADRDRNGEIDLYDMVNVTSCKNVNTPACLTKGDVNGDGQVNDADAHCVSYYYGHTCATTRTPSPTGFTSLQQLNTQDASRKPTPRTSLLQRIINMFTN